MTRPSEPITVDALAERLRVEQGSTRRLIGIAGPPGAGKSTVTEALAARIGPQIPGGCAVLPMDGFHYDDAVLNARGDRARKGAPHTFDAAGLAAMLRRMRDEPHEIAVPVFDRALEIARAGARIIGPEVRLVLVEGNYLLLDDPRWQPLRAMFDLTVMLDVPLPVLEARLLARWGDLPADQARAKVEGNDLPNARLVVARSLPADLVIADG